MEQGRYFCESCERRYDAPGDCASCAEEPLLDLDDAEVMDMLFEMDRQREVRWVGTAIGIAAIPAVLAGAGAMIAGSSRRLGGAAAAAVALAIMGVGRLVAPPKKKLPTR